MKNINTENFSNKNKVVRNLIKVQVKLNISVLVILKLIFKDEEYQF